MTGLHLCSLVNINLQQQREEFGILKQGVAHFDGLVLGRKRLSHKDRLFKVVVGDFLWLSSSSVNPKSTFEMLLGW